MSEYFTSSQNSLKSRYFGLCYRLAFLVTFFAMKKSNTISHMACHMEVIPPEPSSGEQVEYYLTVEKGPNETRRVCNQDGAKMGIKVCKYLQTQCWL